MINKVKKEVFRHPKILIGTLYSGENELNDCIKSVKKQNYTNWKHKIFRNLPNKEAHDTLYGFFMNNQKEYDLFIKLDADMVFINKNALDEIVNIFRKNKNLDHLVTAVHDFFSDSLIMGLHIFSNKVWWEKNEDDLFVDPNPSRAGKKINIKEVPAPFVTHSPNPSLMQAYNFGVHRTSKAIQPQKIKIKKGQAFYQWNLIKKIWFNFKKTGDIRLGLTILGAEDVLAKKYDHNNYKNIDSSVIEEKNKLLKDKKFLKKISSKWDNKIFREFRFYKKTFFRLLICFFIRKTKKYLSFYKIK
jgi:hypothetical protein